MTYNVPCEKENSNGACIWYSEIKDISAFNFDSEFPFNIGLYDKCFFLLFVGYYATCNEYFIKPRILFSYPYLWHQIVQQSQLLNLTPFQFVS
jgi:hypothetical protein